MDLREPIPLKPDNFTPLTRTPWAGREIGRHFKRGLVSGAEELAVGESWEFSCDPDFPSRVMATGKTIAELVAVDPSAVLSPRLARGATCEILVKLLNAAEPLSVQIHPFDDDPNLKPNECGKPESWYILDAEPGAGLYLGFSKAMSREDLRRALTGDAESCRKILHFVPVKPGDYFEIEPGVPHAIGPGVTLLEPQRILFGKSGKTYRMWDWGRRYAADGSADPLKGQPRELHIEEALRLTDPERQTGEVLERQTRRTAVITQPAAGWRIETFPENPYYQVRVVTLADAASGVIAMAAGYGALVMLDGETTWKGANGKDVVLRKGMSALLPFAAFPLSVEASQARFALMTPVGAGVTIRA